MLKKDVRKGKGYIYDIAKDSSLKNDSETRFKTELCRNWDAGICEYGDKCYFAHGLQELRDKVSNKVLKEKCENYFKYGYCINGIKCLFSHLDDVSSSNRKSPSQPQKPDKIFQVDPPLFIDLETRNP